MYVYALKTTSSLDIHSTNMTQVKQGSSFIKTNSQVSVHQQLTTKHIH